jgi:uncharacterized membrane protein
MTAINITIANADSDIPVSDREKCYAIAKPGENDCGGTDSNGEKQTCQAWFDGNPKDLPYTWVYVKRGECAKLGGTFSPPPAPPKKSEAEG